jgi:hypothetical protein
VNETINDPNETTETPSGFSRRKFLIGGGVGAIAVVAAACGGSDGNSSAASGTPKTTDAPSTSDTMSGDGDAKTAALAASLEVLAVGTYKAALEAATANKLGPVPPAVGAFVGNAIKQHQAALDAWNGVITNGGGTAVSAPPASLKATVDGEFAKVKDITGAAKLALLLEQTASDTYLSAVPALQDKAAITLAGGLQIACQEHAAILHYVLGEYPVPDVFQNTDKAFSG